MKDKIDPSTELANHGIGDQLRWVQKLVLNFYLYYAFKVNDFKDRLVSAFEEIQGLLASESHQTKEMLAIYVEQAKGKASRKDIKKANRQFTELLKGLGLGVVLVLPLSFLTLPFLVRLARKLGIEILPESVKTILD